MPDNNVIITTQKYKFDGREVIEGVKKTTKAAKDNFEHVQDAVNGVDESIRDVSKTLSKYESAVKETFKSEKQRLDFLLTHTKKVTDAENDLLTATDEESKSIRANQEELEKHYKLAIAGASHYTKELHKIHEATNDLLKKDKEHRAGMSKELSQSKRILNIREAMDDLNSKEASRKSDKITQAAGYDTHAMGEDLGDAFKDAIGSIGSRDMAGMAGGLFKAFGSLGKAAKGGLMRAEAKHDAAGGGGGGMTKAMAGMSKVLNSFSSLLPMITVLSGSLLAVVKIFLDADAAAKEFNKSILESTSTSGFLAKNFGNANAAAQDVKETMADMYSQATSLDNLNWGISKETHTQVMSALGAQGVQLEKTEEYFDAIKAGRVESQGMVKDWGSMTKMSVAYSRAFGVSVSEVTDLQGEMMSELGMSFDGVQAGFQAMADGATEAGVASNKFFGQMRAISSDMSLFNNRTEASAKLMAKLDQAMSPKKATEFFGTISKFFKGMGVMDRAKVTLAAGAGNTKGIEQKSLASSVKGLSADFDQIVPGMGREFQDALGKKGNLQKFMAKNGKKLNGEQKDAIMKASRLQAKVARGDTLSLASGLADMDPMSTIDELDAVAKTRFGKPIEDLTQMEREGMKAYTNMDDDMMDSFANMKMAMDGTKEGIVEKLSSGEKLTKDEAAMMEKLGITWKDGLADADAAKKLGHKDSKDIYNSMSKDQKELLSGSEKTVDQAKRQGDLTQSLMDKMGVFMDFIMREVYEVLVGIYDAIPGGDKQAKAIAKLQVQAMKAGNKDLAAQLAGAKNMGEVHDSVYASKSFKSQGDAILGFAASQKKLQDTIKGIDDKGPPSEADAAKKKQLQDELKAQQDERTKLIKVLGAHSGNTEGAVETAAKRAGVDPKNNIEFRKAFNKNSGDLAKTLTDVGYSIDEQSKILEKLRLDTDLEPLLSTLGKKDEDHDRRLTGSATPPVSSTPAAQVAPSPAQAASAPASAKPITPDDLKTSTDVQSAAIQDGLDDLARKNKSKSGGVVLNGSFLKSQYGSQVEDSVYNAASRALFEFWMYQDTNKGDALKALKAGAGVRNMGDLNLQQMVGGKSAAQSMGSVADNQVALQAKGHADGGVVGRPAPGEFFASVKPGEKIVPVGGGGGATKVVLELKGDMLKQIIRATALDTINEHDRAKQSR